MLLGRGLPARCVCARISPENHGWRGSQPLGRAENRGFLRFQGVRWGENHDFLAVQPLGWAAHRDVFPFQPLGRLPNRDCRAFQGLRRTENHDFRLFGENYCSVFTITVQPEGRLPVIVELLFMVSFVT